MSATATDWSEPDARKLVKRRLIGAVGQNRAFSLAGLGERVFARLFKGLVYPQIWEDPEVDMEALQIRAGHQASSPSHPAVATPCRT